MTITPITSMWHTPSPPVLYTCITLHVVWYCCMGLLLVLQMHAMPLSVHMRHFTPGGDSYSYMYKNSFVQPQLTYTSVEESSRGSPIALPVLYFYWSLYPVAAIVHSRGFIVSILLTIVSFSNHNHRPRLEWYRVAAQPATWKLIHAGLIPQSFSF